jgi:hypothetical protein
MNFLLASPVFSDEGTITGSQAYGDNDLSNLQKRSLSRIYRTDSSCQINIDLGQARNINFVAIIGHNSSGTVTVKAGSTSGVSDYSSGSLNLITGDDEGYNKNLFANYFESQEYRYWQLDIVGGGDYFQAGRIYLSQAFIPETNASYGANIGFIDNSKITRSISNEPVPTNRPILRRCEFTFDFGSEEEMMGTLYEIDRTRGTKSDVLYVRDLEGNYFQKNYVYGLMDETTPIVNKFYNIFQKSYRITEIP